MNNPNHAKLMNFRNVWALSRKELQLYFYSPVAYIILFVFSLVLGIFFTYYLAAIRDAVIIMPAFMQVFLNLLLFATPFYTMGLLAGEKRAGTIEVLWSLPVTDLEIAAGKFLGSFLFFLLLTAGTLVYVILLLIIGKPDLGMIVANYVGIVLMGAAFISFGLLASSFTKNQIVSAMLCFLVLLLFMLLNFLTGYLKGLPRDILSYFVITEHFMAFNKGVFSLAGFVFLLSITVFNVYLTSRVLGGKK